MNREILFRGRSWAGIWVTGNLSLEFGKAYIRSEWQDDSSPSGPAIISVEVDPATVGQFTGLLDKNGKRIFEGDLILVKSHPDYSRDLFTVRFIYGSFDLNLGSGKGRVSFGKYFYDAFERDVIESYDDVSTLMQVKGNIHDNPELAQ